MLKVNEEVFNSVLNDAIKRLKENPSIIEVVDNIYSTNEFQIHLKVVRPLGGFIDSSISNAIKE